MTNPFCNLGQIQQFLTDGTYCRHRELLYLNAVSVVEGRQQGLHQGEQVGLNICSCLQTTQRERMTNASIESLPKTLDDKVSESVFYSQLT